ncbi:MAG: hypothetical protein R6V47_03515, partial [Candidatus Delongbacteria bacterium]
MSSIRIILAIIFSLTIVYAQDPCEEKKEMYENTLEEWNTIKTKMESIEISKSEYDEMLPEYNRLWQESERLKAEYLKCKDEAENKHKAVYNQGIKLKKEKEYQKALDKFVEAIEIESNFEEAYEQAAEISAQIAADYTYVGCHTYLWNFAEEKWSDVASK